MKEIILTILFLVFVAIGVVIVPTVMILRNSKKAILKNAIKDHNCETDKELFQFLKNKYRENTEDVSPEILMYYDSFVDYSIETTHRIALENFANAKSKNIIPANMNINVYSELIMKLLKSSEFEEVINALFMRTVVSNIQEADKNEKEAIEYLNNFGKEPDGEAELHPREPILDKPEAVDNTETSVDELMSTGTVEEIEN